MKIDNTPLYVPPAQNDNEGDSSASSERDSAFPQPPLKNQSFSRNGVGQQAFKQLTNGSRSTGIAPRNRRGADSTPAAPTRGAKPRSIDSSPSPLNQIDETSVATGNAQTFTIFGTNEVLQPNSSYSLPQREKRVEDYAKRVKTRIAEIESGSEAQRNVNFLNARPFSTPLGYFSGGLMAAGYDPHEKITVAFPHFVHPPGGFKHQDRVDERTYEAWEIAAGVLEHDRPEKGGILTSSDTKIAAADQARVKELESLGTGLQAHWEQDVSEPMRDSSGALAIRSGKADAYTVRATLQGLRADQAAFKQLSPEGQQAISRTLDKNGQVIIPNLYGYPLAGHAFIPYKPYDGNYENPPNQGLMMDLNRGSVSEIHGDDDFARWAKNTRGNLLQDFNDSDRQGGRDAHWPKADEVLDKLIAGNQTTYYGYENQVSDQSIPVRELFNYTRSRGSDYQLKHGNLTAGAGDKDAGIASQYQAVNAKNAVWADQTKVFGLSQQNWKSAKEFVGNTFSYLPIVGDAVRIGFGIHDSLHGMTAKDRIGGNVAAVIAGLQLVHDVARGAAELTLGKSPSALRFSKPYDSGWKHDPNTSEFVFAETERVKPQSRLQGTGMSSSPSGTSQSGSAHLNQGIAAGGTELKPEEALLRQQELQQLVKQKYSPPYPAIPAVRTQEEFQTIRTGILQEASLKGGGGSQSTRSTSAPSRSRSVAPQVGEVGSGASFKSLQDLLDESAKRQKIEPFSVDYMLKHDYPIPPKVYRGHRDPASSPDLVNQHGLQRASGGPDDYLAAIVQHTSRNSGSAGQVLSLSANKSVALRFAKGKSPIYEIDTTQSPDSFRTVTDILVKDGMRLVGEGKITRATLVKAIEVSQGTTEREIFYVPGDIPPTLVTSVPRY